MMKTLNIVNGDACINIMKKAQIKGDFLAWRDFLHEGPVPTKLPLNELSTIRAKFIINSNFLNTTSLEEDFKTRDAQLALFKNYQKIVLWFEHDLYDQLQLLQVLSWFSKQHLEGINLTLICTNNYLGESSIQQIHKLLHYETPILKEHLTLAYKAWKAFGHNTPEEWVNLLDEPTSLLPFLQSAIYRMLEEYPSTKCGLSRTAYQALLIISNGINQRIDVFVKCQSFEERKFMGDLIFWKILDDFENYGVIQNHDTKLTITPLGQKLLKGKESWLNIKPLEHFIGGVHLSASNLWCWDRKNKTIKKYYYSKHLKSLLKVK